MKKLALLALCSAALAFPAFAQAPTGEEAKETFPSPNEIVDKADAKDWVAISPSDLLVMDLVPDRKGNPRRVVIQLMPPPFSQGWIGNMRKLAKAHWWDGTSVNRVQDNYVVQWGDASEKKPLPEGLVTVAESKYASSLGSEEIIVNLKSEDLQARRHFLRLPTDDSKEQVVPISIGRDSYSTGTMIYRGWPIAVAGDKRRSSPSPNQVRGISILGWPIHCYGMVGVGRGYSPDTGTGAELYTVIGHAPRHLDRNIALVGRIIEGMEHLSSLPRGTGPLGFYEKAEQRVPILSVRLGNELEETPPPLFEYLSTESDSFAKYADARANRRDPFFIKPAGGADICNIPVPVRRVKAEK